MRSPALHRPVVLSLVAVVASLLALPSPGASAADTDPAVARAAQVNHLSTAQVRARLRADPALHIADTGRFYFVDAAAAPTATAPRVAAEPAAPLDQTFLLHSNPTSTHTIHLDFDGSDVTGTEWNAEGLPDGHYGGWDPAHDGDTTFADSERIAVQEIWRRVAEDYAPFDVDVTTEDPGAAALARSNAEDTAFGVRVAFTDSTAAWGALCGKGCGGTAMVGTFNQYEDPDDVSEPTWVFPAGLRQDPAIMADAASHEVGHNIGLGHDGGGDGGPYFPGNRLWGPIMGAPYGSGLSQWSQGSYSGANNQQDDVAIITGVLGSRPDEAPGDIVGAPPLGTGHGFIGSAADRDTYAVGDCTGTVNFTATPAESGADLDISLELLDARGEVIASADPTATYDGPGSSRASGLDAALTVELGAGADYVRVDGTGRGSWATSDDYDDYASLGEYQLQRVSGTCGSGEGDLPAAPTDVVATAAPDAPEVTVTWQLPADAGSSSLTGYQVSVVGGPSVTVGPEVRSHTFTGLVAGTTYTVKVAAVSGVGTGPSASAQAATAVPAQAPSAPQGLVATPDAVLPQVKLAWSAPAAPGTSPVTGYEVSVDGTLLTTTALLTATVGDLAPGTTHEFGVAAVSAAGKGPAATVLATTAATTPSEPQAFTLTADPTRPEVAFSWQPPASTGGSPIELYRVYIDGVLFAQLPAQVLGSFVDLLPGTTYDFAVEAVNGRGTGPAVHATVKTSGQAPPPVSAGPTRTAISVPSKVRKGRRPTVKVTVTPVGSGAVPTGQVRLTVGRKTVTLTLKAGVASYKAPRQKAVGKVRVTAVYFGTHASGSSTSRKSFKVVR
ncbi:MAG TPA: fibronectin type III domain-containing protein [Nocardioides sp.]|nr:fibronectin type III domain-containing protein [Nocardioides sp.]